MKTQDRETQLNTTPAKALQILKNGNSRFINNLKINRNLLQQVNDTKEGQHPFAVILSCIDSRTPSELVFDQGLGDICSVRIAGNVINEDILGSLEFACKMAGAKIIVVLGHSKCDAIWGACNNTRMGHFTQLLQKLKPSVELTARQSDSMDVDAAFLDAVAENHVHLSLNYILERSAILREMVHTGELGIVGAFYDIESGEVRFNEKDTVINEKLQQH